MDVLLSYEGANIGRRTSGWTTSGTAANAEIGPSIAKLRDRSRDLVRNTPYGERGISELVTQTIGTGITAQARGAEEPINRVIDEIWAKWNDECDADGQLDFNGIQELVTRSVLESGECLIRYRPRLSDDGLSIPLQLQVIEPDLLDHSKTEVLKNVQYTTYVIQGVEHDLIGRRLAYWMFPQHPGDVLQWPSRSLSSERIPAREIVHVYRKKRPGQVRGVPVLAPVIMAMRDLDEYQDALRVRAKIEACLAAFVTAPGGEDVPTIGTTTTDDSGKRIEEFRPGMIMYGKPGEDVKFFAPTGVGGYAEYVRQNERSIATGMGLTYEQLTGDLSNVNYSSYRAGLLSFRTGIQSFRWLCLIPGFLQPIRRRFIDNAFAAGKIPDVIYQTEWTPPSFGSIDPLKDAEAADMDLRTGRATWPQAVAEQGFDPRKQIAEIKRWKSELEAAGLTFNSKNSKAVTNEKNQATNPAP